MHHAAKHYQGETLWFWRRGANAAKKPTIVFWHPGVVINNTLATVWVANRGSAVKCARSQARSFHEDDEAAHEHVTEQMRKLENECYTTGEFPYENITGQDEPQVDSSPATKESTVARPSASSGEDPVEVEPDVRRRMRGKTRTARTDQPTTPLSEATTDTARQETVGDHDDKRRRVDEPETPLSPVVQNEAPVLNPVSFNMETKNDRCRCSVA